MQKGPISTPKSKRLELFQQIRHHTYQTFNCLFKQKFKKQYQTSNIYTVICSIWIIDKITYQLNKCRLVGLANGTKTLPYSIYANNKTYLLKDMHAQILVIKAFRKFILKQIISQKSLFFIKDTKRNKFLFNNNKYEIVLFSSEPFCGDCSINQDQNIFSGSKPLKYFNSLKLPNQKFQKYVLRTKPGRTDLPQNKKSLSLCCSDKLALYNILGIQGKQLFDKVSPVYIDCFIVECNNQSQITIEKGLNFIFRLANLRNQSEELVKRKILNIKIDQKQRKISNQFKSNQPQVLCIQKLPNEQNSSKLIDKDSSKLIEGDSLSKKKDKQGFQVSLIYDSDYFEWINNKTGLPEGCSLSDYMKQRKTSLFSKSVFQNQISQFVTKSQNSEGQNRDQSQSTQEIFKYSAIKDRIKFLFGIWTDHFKIKNQFQSFSNN